jgi:hypothetical protein
MKKQLLILALPLFLISCAKDEPVGLVTKQMEVRLLDNSIGRSMVQVDFDSLRIDLQQVRVKLSGNSNTDWIDINTNAGIYELVGLQWGSDSLVAVGSVTGIELKEARLILGSMNSIYVDGAWHELTIPSSSSSGLKLKFQPGIILDDLDALVIDFNSEAAVHQQGNGSYTLSPVIKVD